MIWYECIKTSGCRGQLDKHGKKKGRRRGLGQKSSLTQLVNWRGLYILHGAQRKKRCIGKGTSSSLNAPQLKRTCTRDGEKSVQRACALDYPGEQLRCVLAPAGAFGWCVRGMFCSVSQCGLQCTEAVTEHKFEVLLPLFLVL